VPDLRSALEAALVDRPEDLASHMAYADYLQEQGDPRGELIQVQLALEDPARPPEERQRLQQRESELIDAHLREWLGEIAYVLLDNESTIAEQGSNVYMLEYVGRGNDRFRFARGWLESLDLNDLNVALAEGLGRCPTIRLLQRLAIRHSDYDEVEETYQALAELAALDCVRSFTLGPDADHCHISGEGIAPVVAKMTRLEELYLYAHQVECNQVFALPMSNLRTLHVYHLQEYPLEVLASNPTLGNLVTLECYPHALEPGDERAYLQPESFRALVYSPHLRSLTRLRINQSDIGDGGVRDLIESGMLKRLRFLDLDNGRISDEGARLLAACPELRRLEVLRICGNQLSEQGIAALAATGVSLAAGGQHSAEAIAEEMQHLWEGDME
jgi:uncharacterized protein (TIGR02996 family)